MTETLRPATPGCNLRPLGTGWSIYRSDALTGLSPETRARVDALGLKTLVDLRSAAERTDHPCDLSQVSGLHYQAVDLSAGLKGTAGSALEGTGVKTLADLYVGFLDRCTQELREILTLLALSPGPALFHCAAGKDRTGVVAMLVLGLGGADDQTIIGDYMATKEAILPLMPFLAQGEAIRRAGPAGRAFLETEPPFIEAALHRIHRTYGGFGAYARDRLGLDEAVLVRFRDPDATGPRPHRP